MEYAIATLVVLAFVAGFIGGFRVGSANVR